MRMIALLPITITDDGELKRGKWSSPEMVLPQGGVRVDDAIEKNRLLLADLFNLKARLEAVDLSGATLETSGPRGARSLSMAGNNRGTRRPHRLQIERVRSSAGFPSGRVNAISGQVSCPPPAG